MPLSSWASVVGQDIVNAAQGVLKDLDEAPKKALEKEEIAARRKLLPLQTAADERTLKQQLSGAKQAKSITHDQHGNYFVLYSDGSYDIKQVGTQGPTRKVKSVHWGPDGQLGILYEDGGWTVEPYGGGKAVQPARPSYVESAIEHWRQGTSTPGEEAVIRYHLALGAKQVGEAGNRPAMPDPSQIDLDQLLGPKGQGHGQGAGAGAQGQAPSPSEAPRAPQSSLTQNPTPPRVQLKPEARPARVSSERVQFYVDAWKEKPAEAMIAAIQAYRSKVGNVFSPELAALEIAYRYLHVDPQGEGLKGQGSGQKSAGEEILDSIQE